MPRTIALTNGKTTCTAPFLFAALLACWHTAAAPDPVLAQTPKAAATSSTQDQKKADAPEAKKAARAATKKAAGPRRPTRADIVRGDYGPYRANNDLLYYHLDVRVDPEKQTLFGKNTIRFRMLVDSRKIQLDLSPALAVDKILLGEKPLKFEREEGAVFVTFPEPLEQGREYSIDFHYSGTPRTTGRFGGFTFGKDPAGKPWIYTSCEGQGASVWWPNKDQWRDEVESMDLSVTIPNDLVDVSNGRLTGKKELSDGFTRWDWHVSYPINNYCVSLNIGNYVHFDEKLGELTLDYYVLPQNLEKAKKQFAQAKPMIEAFQHYFGEYPFQKDGYKLIEVPYAGMEHQSAVAYGNHFANGYYGRDFTGVGISSRFDFIIIHESGHEWFGNSVSAVDKADMWIHEGWTTYLECLVCRIPIRTRRRDQIRERIQANGAEPPAGRGQAGDEHRAGQRSVLQRCPVLEHAAQCSQRRQEVVGSLARVSRSVQVQEHHDGRCGRVFQQGDRQELDAHV